MGEAIDKLIRQQDAKKRKGRPTRQREFRFDHKQDDGGAWMENMNFKPGVAKSAQPAPKWVSANHPPTGDKQGEGKPLPPGEEWGVPPDAEKFIRIWATASSIEDVKRQIWWCSKRRLTKEKGVISQWLEDNNFNKLRNLRSRAHLFGGTKKQAGASVKRLLDKGYITKI